jgi:hypothetical protein
MSGRRIVFASFCAAMALAAAQGMWVVTGLSHWMRTWLKGFYGFYLALHLPIVWLAVTVYLYRVRVRGARGGVAVAMYGLVVGYLAGFLTVLCTPLSQPNAWQRVFSLPRLDEWVGILIEPFVLLSWLFGGVVGLTAFALSRPWHTAGPRSDMERLPGEALGRS